MNKSDLIDAIANSTGSNKAEAGRALEAVLGAITSTLQSGEKVTIPGFGHLRLGTEMQEWEEILKLVNLYKLKLQTHLDSKLVKLLRML